MVTHTTLVIKHIPVTDLGHHGQPLLLGFWAKKTRRPLASLSHLQWQLNFFLTQIINSSMEFHMTVKNSRSPEEVLMVNCKALFRENCISKVFLQVVSGEETIFS